MNAHPASLQALESVSGAGEMASRAESNNNDVMFASWVEPQSIQAGRQDREQDESMVPPPEGLSEDELRVLSVFDCY